MEGIGNIICTISANAEKACAADAKARTIGIVAILMASYGFFIYEDIKYAIRRKHGHTF